MGVPKYYSLLVVFVISLLYFNFMASKEIYDWVPSVRKQIILFFLVWFLPLIGIFFANKYGNLGLFDKQKSKNGDSAISGGFLLLHSIFNPGVKNTIEMVEKQKSDLNSEYKKSNDGSDDKDKNI